NQEIEVLESPTSLSGEDILPGFILDLQPIF
ncbi:MAG: Uma2 family endonuclease, partial [Dolichospermum sp.]